ncbi:hypothetical protein ABT348_32955 [Streptomyces olivaceus]|uniref:hypothetical protein n=1 Tax=Streptomyces olivaceus TaxID=47716 RepID=UPI0033280735
MFKRIGIVTSDAEFSGASLAALAAGPDHAGHSGTYFQAQDGNLSAVLRSARVSYDEQRAAKLWDDSRKLVGLTAEEEALRLA